MTNQPNKNQGCSPSAILVVVASVAIIGGFVFWQSRGSGAGPGPVLRDAYIDSQVFVSHQLKAPASAAFPYWDGTNSADLSVVDAGTGRARVTAYVDAPNSFGAMLRTRYTAVMVWASGSDWSLESLQFN